MDNNRTLTVTGIALLEEGKWSSLKEALDAIIRDPRLTTCIIVSNSSSDKEKALFFATMYASKIILHQETKETGRAGLLAKAIELAQKQSTDYVLFLDSDAIPEDKTIDTFFDNLKYFTSSEQRHAIMIGNTVDIFGEEKSFYNAVSRKDFKDGTLFDILNVKKSIKLVKRMFGIKEQTIITTPIFRTQAFIGGGVFVPMTGIQKAALPDASLFMYGEDVEYAWKLKEAGYSFFQCTHPIIRKPSSEKKQHHVFGLFDAKTPDHEAYYHIRNAVIISRAHTYQSKPVLFINIVLWISLALIFGFWETSSFSLFFHRAKIIVTAVLHGYFDSRDTPLL